MLNISTSVLNDGHIIVCGENRQLSETWYEIISPNQY